LASPQVNAIYCGDCKEVLHQYIPDDSIDLIYADPPFFSDRHYEILWGDGYELRAFADRWKGGIENYIAWMEDKLRECERVLKEDGSIYLHCDWHASHHLKVLMDRIFGRGNFKSEVIWRRQTAHSDTKQGVKNYGHIHDALLFYARGNYPWNAQFLPYDEEYTATFYKHKDPDGRRFTTSDLTGSKPGGDVLYAWHEKKPYKGRYWAYSKDNMEKFEKEGRLYYSKSGMPRLKHYLDEMPGVSLQDVWTDITPAGIGKERLGYPTQKPEKLMERIIAVSSNSLDLVLDPFCGCGTAVAVAHRLGRRWIGIDISPTACRLMASRMRKLGFSIQDKDIIGLPRTLDEIKGMQPFEFQNWVMQKLMARVSKTMIGDMGIDGWTLDNRPIQVKQSESVGRNVIDNFETALVRAKKKGGIIVALSFGKGAYEEAARAKLEQGVEIELKTVEDILKES
jgi:DNA modification methylase